MEIAVLGFAERGVRSSVVRLPNVAHSTRDSTGFLAQLIAIAKDKGVAGYAGDGAVADEGIPFREIAQGIGGHLGLPAERVPADGLAHCRLSGKLTGTVMIAATSCSPRLLQKSALTRAVQSVVNEYGPGRRG